MCMNWSSSCRDYTQQLLHLDLPVVPWTVWSQLLLRLRGEHGWFTFSRVRRYQSFLVIWIEQTRLLWKNDNHSLFSNEVQVSCESVDKTGLSNKKRQHC